MHTFGIHYSRQKRHSFSERLYLRLFGGRGAAHPIVLRLNISTWGDRFFLELSIFKNYSDDLNFVEDFFIQYFNLNVAQQQHINVPKTADDHLRKHLIFEGLELKTYPRGIIITNDVNVPEDWPETQSRKERLVLYGNKLIDALIAFYKANNEFCSIASNLNELLACSLDIYVGSISELEELKQMNEPERDNSICLIQ